MTKASVGSKRFEIVLYGKPEEKLMRNIAMTEKESTFDTARDSLIASKMIEQVGAESHTDE